MQKHPSDRLTAYVDGELTQEEAAEIAAHLAECAHCREVVSDLRAVQMLLRSLPEPSPDPSLLLQTRARLESIHAQKPSLPRWLIAGAVAVAVAAFVALLPLSPPPGAHELGAIWHFRHHAQLASIHPLSDVTLASYLSSPLPYDTLEEAVLSREGP
ncbi:MAG: zf-HC2 domain-containing protein [Armatimonadota bacterium]|nr:zf-HC2 domain-containing protein [Armatimonadota bacterium]